MEVSNSSSSTFKLRTAKFLHRNSQNALRQPAAHLNSLGEFLSEILTNPLSTKEPPVPRVMLNSFWIFRVIPGPHGFNWWWVGFSGNTVIESSNSTAMGNSSSNDIISTAVARGVKTGAGATPPRRKLSNYGLSMVFFMHSWFICPTSKTGLTS